jgi:protein HIRA/HIR1
MGGGGRALGQPANEGPSVENWRVVLALRGHGNNVADLAWSPDDRYIATASLDGTVIVWDVQAALGGGGGAGGAANAANANIAAAAPQRAATLTAHVGFVKGVAWDPMGTYLASQGDDGVRVWRTASGGWAQVAHIEAPFSAASRTNFFLRLSWTPDGQYLIAANAYDRRVGRNVAPFFQRDVWRCDGPGAHQLVGHNAPVLSVRANPRLFSLPVAVRRDDREAAELAAMMAAEEEGGGGGEGGAGAAREEGEDAPAAVTTSDQQQQQQQGGGAAAAKPGGAAAAAAAAGRQRRVFWVRGAF